MTRNFYLVLSCVILYSCGNEGTKEVKLTGLNGSAFYQFGKTSNSVKQVMKEEYVNFQNIHNVTVSINKDTLKTGDTFEGTLIVFQKNYKIKIIEPKSEFFEGNYDEKSDQIFEGHRFKFKCDSAGLFLFSGTIEYDTIEYNFFYKFKVIE